MKIDPANIGLNIKRVRLKHKLTQAQFAEIIGKSQSTVYCYENGSIIPPFKVLIRISKLFNVTINTLMGVEVTITDVEVLHALYEQHEEE